MEQIKNPQSPISLERLNQLAAKGQLIGYFDVDNETYHAGPGVSKSDLDEIHKSPAHLAAKKSKKLEKTEGLIFGSQFHTYILEPHLFDWEILEGVKKTKKEGKISQDSMDAIINMKANIMKNRYAKQCLSGIREKACYWLDPDLKVLCKCKPDIMAHHVGMGVDLKSATNNDVQKFHWVAKNRRHDLQGCFYLDGIYYAGKQSGEVLFENTLTSFMFIVSEKEAPHSLKTLLLGANTMKKARKVYKEDLARYKSFFGTNPSPDWEKELPGFEEKIEILDL